jgi:ankyrin repeat protein
MWAARAGREQAARRLIGGGADVDAISADGATALSLAKRAGHDGVVVILQEAGANR